MEPHEWENFIIAVAEDEATDSRLYQLLVNHFPLQFLHKLMSVVQSGSTNIVKIYAIDLINHNLLDMLRERYATLDRNLVGAFQKSAMSILMVEVNCIYVPEFGRDIVGTLLELTLEQNIRWEDFESVAAQLLIPTEDEDEKLKSYVIDIIVNLKEKYRLRLMSFMSPQLGRLHFSFLLWMFECGDARAFCIITSILHLFPHIESSELIEEAATSCLFFSTATKPWERCLGASELAFCIQHFNLELSPRVLSSLTNIVSLMFQSKSEDAEEEKRVAVQLCTSLLMDCFGVGKFDLIAAKGWFWF